MTTVIDDDDDDNNEYDDYDEDWWWRQIGSFRKIFGSGYWKLAKLESATIRQLYWVFKKGECG